MSAAVETDRLKVGEVVLRRNPRRADAHRRYWVVFVFPGDDSVSIVPEDRQGVREVVAMADLMRAPSSPTRYPA